MFSALVSNLWLTKPPKGPNINLKGCGMINKIGKKRKFSDLLDNFRDSGLKKVF